MITFHVLSIFPGMFPGVLEESIIKRAQEKGLVQFNIVDIRDYAYDKHKCTDDYPFGGGPGMLMKVEPVYQAFMDVLAKAKTSPHKIFMSPRGKTFDQQKAIELSKNEDILILCGRYEGIDERIREMLIDEEISIGDYVLTGGELPAMVLMDAVLRMIPGVLGDENSFKDDSFYEGILGYPQYTRPREFQGRQVPEVLLSGHHQKINQWRRKNALALTLRHRPDLLERTPLSEKDQKLLAEIRQETE